MANEVTVAIVMPCPTEPCSNCRQINRATVYVPADASNSEVTTSREAMANTIIIAASRLGATSGSTTRRSAYRRDALVGAPLT